MKAKRVETIRRVYGAGASSYAMRCFVSAFSVLAVLLIAWPAAAVTLGECYGEECTCDPEFVEGQGFDICSMTNINEIPLPDLPCQFRAYLGIEATYDEEHNVYEISSNVPHGNSVVLSPQHNGYFETFAELEDYLGKFLFGFGCPGMTPEFPEPNLCDASTWNFLDAQNPVYRWTPDPGSGGEWSDYQPENFLNAALFNDDGYLRIDDIDVDLRIFSSEECKTDADGLLEATQCSRVFESVGYNVSDEVCDNDIPTIFDTIKAQTEEKNIRWDEREKEVVSVMIFPTEYFLIRDVVVDRIWIKNTYFDGLGSDFWIPQYGSQNWEVREWFGTAGPRKLDRNRPEGVCGEGLVERDDFKVRHVTEAGTGQCQ